LGVDVWEVPWRQPSQSFIKDIDVFGFPRGRDRVLDAIGADGDSQLDWDFFWALNHHVSCSCSCSSHSTFNIHHLNSGLKVHQ
jgi:hypothetical protein